MKIKKYIWVISFLFNFDFVCGASMDPMLHKQDEQEKKRTTDHFIQEYESKKGIFRHGTRKQRQLLRLYFDRGYKEKLLPYMFDIQLREEKIKNKWIAGQEIGRQLKFQDIQNVITVLEQRLYKFDKDSSEKKKECLEAWKEECSGWLIKKIDLEKIAMEELKADISSQAEPSID